MLRKELLGVFKRGLISPLSVGSLRTFFFGIYWAKVVEHLEGNLAVLWGPRPGPPGVLALRDVYREPPAAPHALPSWHCGPLSLEDAALVSLKAIYLSVSGRGDRGGSGLPCPPVS